MCNFLIGAFATKGSHLSIYNSLKEEQQLLHVHKIQNGAQKSTKMWPIWMHEWRCNGVVYVTSKKSSESIKERESDDVVKVQYNFYTFL